MHGLVFPISVTSTYIHRMATPSRQGARRAEGLSLLRALVANLSSSARAVERQTGITNAQLFLLQELASSGPSSLGDLAEMARTQPSTVSIVIGRLQKAGYVTRKPATDDRRRVVIALTAAGTRLVVRAPVAPPALAPVRVYAAADAPTGMTQPGGSSVLDLWAIESTR